MSLLLNLRHALRLLRRSPSVTAISVRTLALCMGANPAIFSVGDATLLRPLAYPEPERLVLVATHFRFPGGEGENTSQDGRTWEAVRNHATYLDTAVYGGGGGGKLLARGDPREGGQEGGGSGVFPPPRPFPLLGPAFYPREGRPRRPPGAALTYPPFRRSLHT